MRYRRLNPAVPLASICLLSRPEPVPDATIVQAVRREFRSLHEHWGTHPLPLHGAFGSMIEYRRTMDMLVACGPFPPALAGSMLEAARCPRA